MICGVYVIQCVAEGPHKDFFYVGSSIDIEKRWGQHRSCLRNRKHHAVKLQEVYDLYGDGCLEYKLLESANESEIGAVEQRWLDDSGAGVSDTCLNTCSTVGAVMTGRKHTAHTKAKMKGRVVGQDTKDKLSAAHTGKKRSPESVAKQKAKTTGMKRTPETCARIAAVKTGVSCKPSTIEALKAVPRTPEWRANMSKSALALWARKKSAAVLKA